MKLFTVPEVAQVLRVPVDLPPLLVMQNAGSGVVDASVVASHSASMAQVHEMKTQYGLWSARIAAAAVVTAVLGAHTVMIMKRIRYKIH